MRPTVLTAFLLATVTSHAWPQRVTRTFNDTTTLTTSTQGVAFVASALLPGAGQYYLKSDRWIPFTAVEAWSWVKYAQHRKRSHELERAYRDLAWEVARRITTSTRKDSVFTYYEAISTWRDSGLFDADPRTAGLQPEPDSTTFNGSQWKRARSLFFKGGTPLPGSAEYEKALAYYRTNAIPEPYIWSWGNNRLEQQEFQETIARSDAAFRSATTMMGVILANHVVSAIDALVLARVKTLQEHHIRIGSIIEPGPSTYYWMTTVHIPLRGAERDRYRRTNR